MLFYKKKKITIDYSIVMWKLWVVVTANQHCKNGFISLSTCKNTSSFDLSQLLIMTFDINPLH